jgi:hypothetical protein
LRFFDGADALSRPSSFSYFVRRLRSEPIAMARAPDESTFSARRASALSCATSQFFALISHSDDFATRA